MRKLICLCFLFALCLPTIALSQDPAMDLDSLFNQVRALEIQRNGYTLGAPLSPAQEELSRKYPLEATSDVIHKFRDGNLHVVVEKAANRVVVMYESYEKQTQQQIRDRVGELFMAFNDPTITAHDQLVYWAWGEKGKFDTPQFELAKEKKRPLKILATVKFTSDLKILDKGELGASPNVSKTAGHAGPAQEAPQRGNAYYVISSDPILFHYNQ
ncbi:MAG: hypothetical protein MI747_02180 [Desulfobacterales bacterium]|nr:hypothetical protein [Desulfobacterales bacterium]